ncbi:MAG TPA: hypothetical protein VL918_05925, partial [Sphingobium sp.]|nr:hypothetical protein [Sphingobium sp.]
FAMALVKLLELRIGLDECIDFGLRLTFEHDRYLLQRKYERPGLCRRGALAWERSILPAPRAPPTGMPAAAWLPAGVSCGIGTGVIGSILR